MKKYDFEAHAYVPEFMGKFDPKNMKKMPPKGSSSPDGRQDNVPEQIADLGEGRLEIMDQNGIDVQVLSFSNGISRLPESEAIPLCRTINNRLAEAVRRYPDRFAAFAQLPEQNPKAACDELDRCMTELGFWGWNTFSNYGKKHLDNEEFYPILKKADELGAVVYLHPDFPTEDSRFQGMGGQVLGGLGYTLDAAITAVRLICTGVFDRHPDLKLIMGHLGEGIPFYLDRIGAKSPTPESRLPALNQHDFHYYFRHNIWVTNSGNFTVPSYLCARDVLGADRILFGSDYPYEHMADAVDFTNRLPISAEELENLYCGNAQKAFRNLP